mgnify:CR=1 FL=1
MEFKTDALVLRTVDYGENDKMVTLFAADRGKIGVCMKGVKKANAKLKFAAQPFAFSEYVIAERAGRYTVTAAALHDGFYGLREDVTAYYAAACVCETCDKLLLEGMVNGALLVEAVSALGTFDGQPSRALIRFLLNALALAGYPVEAGNCPVCGRALSGRMAFDMRSGSFLCTDCGEGAPASESTYLALRAARGTGEGTADGEKRALRLLSAYFTYQTEEELSSLGQYISLI